MPDRPELPKPAPGLTARQRREARLAEALRANLKRRKAAGRGPTAPVSPVPSKLRP